MAEQKMQWQQVAPGGLKGKVVSAHGGSGVSFICLGEMNTGQDLTITSDDLPFVIRWLQMVQTQLEAQQ